VKDKQLEVWKGSFNIAGNGSYISQDEDQGEGLIATPQGIEEKNNNNFNTS
jgi:hypothetical protein